MTTNQPNEFGHLISQKITSEADTFYYHYDALGSTAALTDSSEVVTDEYAFEAFGETAAESGATPNPYQWVAQVGYRKDEETSLYDLRRRNYDVSTGRFVSEDPVRSDEENLYRYVGNRPVGVTDASGLEVFAKRKVVAEQVLEWLEQKGLHPGAIRIAEAADLWYIEIPITDLPKLNEIRRDEDLDPFFERLYGTINWPNHLLVHQNGDGKIHGSFIPMPEVGDAGVIQMIRLLDHLNWDESAKANAAFLFQFQLLQIEWARKSDWERARMTERAFGLLQAVGGLGEIALGTAVITTGTAETALLPPSAPVSIPQTLGGWALFGHGIDNLWAGGMQILTGEWQRTLGALALDRITGNAELSELIYGVVGIAGEMKAATTILRNTNTLGRETTLGARVVDTLTDIGRSEQGGTVPIGNMLGRPPTPPPGTAGAARVTGQALEELSGEAKIAAPTTGLRQQYTDAIAALKGTGDDLLRQGLSKEDVARKLHEMRRQLGVQFKDMTPPDLLEYIHKFNIHRYGDKLGPTFESLIAKGKTFDDIIESASRPLGDAKQLGAALQKLFGDEILPILRKYDMLP